MRRVTLVLAGMALALVLASGVALAEMKIGTDGPDTIVGTNSNDHITGMGGDDTLQGKAGDDIYHFADSFGQDTLTETAFVNVGGTRLPGGTDTLNFSGYTPAPSNSPGSLLIRMIPQWAAAGYNRVDEFQGIGTESVELGSSPVENAVGGAGFDEIIGGSANNTYKGGDNDRVRSHPQDQGDNLIDYGGDNGSAVGDVGLPDLRASDDTYKGFTVGYYRVGDYGGAADTIDLRPLETSDVYFGSLDTDGNGSDESLRIVINSFTAVTVYGHFSAQQEVMLENGRVEQIIFSNEVVTSTASMM